MIDAKTKNQISQSIGEMLNGILTKYDSSAPSFDDLSCEKVGQSGELKPFHEALVSPLVTKVSRYERSLSTTMGSMFEVVAELVGKQNFAFAQRQYKVEGKMGTAASTTIESIRNKIETEKMQGNYLAYVDTIESAFHADTVDRSVKADLYLLDADGNEMFFEMKTPKPNKSQCLDTTEKLLKIHALRQSGPPRVRTFYAMSYNPYGSRMQYDHSFAMTLLDMKNQVLLGDEFWDLLGGSGTYEQVLELFVQAGHKHKVDASRVLGL